MRNATVSLEEVERFDALAEQWWNPDGPMRPLHRMNPARIGWIVDRIDRCFSVKGRLRLLDVGCGAGLAAEALALRGFDVLGLDAARSTIEVARAHAHGKDLRLTYRTGAVDELAAEGAVFDVITVLEVIEHVPDPTAFVAILRRLLAPGGLLFVSTLNRTPQALLTAKIGAEYIFRVLPAGTHDWRRFITPAEMAAMLRKVGLLVTDTTGLCVNPVSGVWEARPHLRVNYLIQATG